MMFILVGNSIYIYCYYYAMLLSYYMLWGKNSIFNIADDSLAHFKLGCNDKQNHILLESHI